MSEEFFDYFHLPPSKLFARGSEGRSPLKLTTFCTYKNKFLKNSTLTILNNFKHSTRAQMYAMYGNYQMADVRQNDCGATWVNLEAAAF